MYSSHIPSNEKYRPRPTLTLMVSLFLLMQIRTYLALLSIVVEPSTNTCKILINTNNLHFPFYFMPGCFNSASHPNLVQFHMKVLQKMQNSALCIATVVPEWFDRTAYLHAEIKDLPWAISWILEEPDIFSHTTSSTQWVT